MIDEPQLIEFFGVLPKPRTQDEREFFAAPVFEPTIDGLVLTFSLSTHFTDLVLELASEGAASPFLRLQLEDLEKAWLEPERKGRRWLVARPQAGGELWLSVDPTLVVEVDRRHTRD